MSANFTPFPARAFVLISGEQYRTLTFAAGETLKFVPVDVIGDTFWERDGKVTVRLEKPQGAVLAVEQADVVIKNDDLPSVATIDDVKVIEGNGGATSVTVVVRYSRPLPRATGLTIKTRDGSARAGQDYLRPGQATLYPAEGLRSFPFKIDIVSDDAPECDEGLLIEYTGSNTGDETTKVARLLIVDDDDGPRGAACPAPFDPPADGGAPVIVLDAGPDARDAGPGAVASPPPAEAGAPGSAEVDARMPVAPSPLPMDADGPAPGVVATDTRAGDTSEPTSSQLPGDASSSATAPSRGSGCSFARPRPGPSVAAPLLAALVFALQRRRR
jgi:hypothetical protein